jgi:hypothetical protein
LLEAGETVIDYATSTDGTTWTPVASSVMGGAGDFDGDGATAPCVIEDSGNYYMWFSNLGTGIDDTDIDPLLADIENTTTEDLWQLQDEVLASIGYAFSTDGQNWSDIDRNIFDKGNGLLNAVATPCVLYDGVSDYEMWYTYGVNSFGLADIDPIIAELSVIDIGNLFDLLAAEDYASLLTELTDIIDSQIPETKSRLFGTSALVGYADSTDGLTWNEDTSYGLTGSSIAPWSSVGRPCVLRSGEIYEMWYSRGVDDLLAQNLVDIWQGTTSTIGYASSCPLAAETVSGLTVDGDGIIVADMLIHRVKDVDTDLTEDIPGGMRGYYARITGDTSLIELVDVRGGEDDFSTPTRNGWDFYCYDGAPDFQPDDTLTAKAVLRLTGDCLTTCNITLDYRAILGHDPAGLNVPEENSLEYTFLRGDANKDGIVNIVDAMFIAQNIVGLRDLSTLNAQNAASVRPDGILGDRLDIIDAMFIAQYIVGLRNSYFE